MKKILLATALLVLTGSSLAQAKMTPSGTSGVINVPTGSVRSIGHISLGGQAGEDGNFVGANFSLLPGLEVAASRVNVKHGDSHNVFSSKLQILPETAVSPALAVGVEDIGDQIDRVGYVAITKNLPWSVKAHGGVGTGRLKNGFIALEKELKSFTLELEYDGHDFNYGAAIPLGKFLQGEVGVRSKNAFAGVNFTF